MSVQQAQSHEFTSTAENEAKRWKWDIRLKVVEIVVIVLGFFVATFFSVEQLKRVDASLVSSNDAQRSSTAAAVYAQQQEIDQLFVDDPSLQPYFWYGAEAPGGSTDPSKPAAVASRMLDHFEHLILQLETGDFDEEKPGWEAYMKQSFKDSPVLCHTLWTDRNEYDGTEAGSMWDRYAKGGCPPETSAS